jgi:hypothetical protein
VRRTTLGARGSASRPEIGILEFLFEVLSASGETLMSQKNVMFIRRRSGEAAA